MLLERGSSVSRSTSSDRIKVLFFMHVAWNRDDSQIRIHDQKDTSKHISDVLRIPVTRALPHFRVGTGPSFCELLDSCCPDVPPATVCTHDVLSPARKRKSRDSASRNSINLSRDQQQTNRFTHPHRSHTYIDSITLQSHWNLHHTHRIDHLPY
jgi:hypothetical protein